MCVTDRHDMTLAVKVALNRYTTNQPTGLIDGTFAAFDMLGSIIRLSVQALGLC